MSLLAFIKSKPPLMNRHFVRFLWLVLWICLVWTSKYSLYGQNSSLSLSSGSVSLVINSTVAGSEPDPDEDPSTSLDWSVQSGSNKVTVSTSSVGQQFSPTVEAINVVAGTSTGTVTLTDGMAETDFVVNIDGSSPGKVEGSCDLRYRGTATASQGTGTDSHTVTFTLTSQ